MKFPLGAMTVGDILDRGLKILVSRFSTFFVINLIFLSPTLLWQLVFTPDSQGAAAALLLFVVAFVLMILGSAAILHVIEREFAGRSVGMHSAIQVALSRFWSLLGATLLFGLLLFLTMLGTMIPGMILVFMTAAVAPIFLLLIGPAVLAGILAVVAWVAVRFCFFSQVVVVERSGGPSALVRSKDLGWGHGWRIFGVLVLVFLINVGAALLEEALNLVLPGTKWIMEEGNRTNPFPVIRIILVNYPYYVINTVVAFLFSIVVSSYLSVCLTLLYFDLRIRKEGFDLELAAQQDLPEVLPLSSPASAPPTPEETPGTDRPW